MSVAQQAVFDNGNQAGLLAQSLFHGGVDLRPESARDFRESLAHTAAAIANGAAVLYKAAFMHDDVLAAVDILCRIGDMWHAYEVKVTRSVKPQHIEDAALQYHVLTSAGVSLHDIRIVHLDTQYVRRGALDLTALFRIVAVRGDIR